MPKHCYQNPSKKNKRWYYRTVNCTDDIKRGKALGTKLEFKPTETQQKRIDFLIAEFKKFGFSVKKREVKSGINKGIYYYAERKHYPTSASFMVTVSLTRYLCRSDNLKIFYERYVGFRDEGLTFVESVKLSHIGEPFGGIPMCFFNVLDPPRSRPDRQKSSRQGGTSIFSKRINYRNYLSQKEEREGYCGSEFGYATINRSFIEKYQRINHSRKQTKTKIKEIAKLYKKTKHELYNWLRSRGFSD